MQVEMPSGQMPENPYESPQANLAPPDLAARRERLKAWLWDRLMLWVVGTVLCCTIVFGMTAILMFLDWLGWINP